MEQLNSSGDGFLENSDGEEEFRSCCAEDEEWKELVESIAEGSKDDVDEFSLRMFFKGVSVCKAEGSASGLSGIGVVMERSPGVPIIQVQKKLDFHVEEAVAEHLALMDGLLEALRSGAQKIFAFTDCDIVHDQISQLGMVENQLLIALGQRILEHAAKLEVFVLKLVPSSELERPLHLAQEAIGLVEQVGDITLQCLPLNNNCRYCQQCRQMIEHTRGCYRMTCWCGHEFCYSCGAEFRDGRQTCQCVCHDAESYEPSASLSNQDPELWRWESFELPPTTMGTYSDYERSQLALMQRFLAGAFDMGDQSPHQSPPRRSDSYVDTIKDLDQLPWLERFVSAISDDYHEGYI